MQGARPGGGLGTAPWAVRGAGAAEVVSALASSFGVPWDTQKHSWSFGGREEAFGDKGQGGGGSPGLQLSLGSPTTVQETMLWAKRDSSAVPAAPSLERCPPLDRMQLLKEPLV